MFPLARSNSFMTNPQLNNALFDEPLLNADDSSGVRKVRYWLTDLLLRPYSVY